MEHENICWPDNFCDIGNLSFKVVFETKKEFVRFTLIEMKQPSGMFLKWKEYCSKREKIEKELKQ